MLVKTRNQTKVLVYLPSKMNYYGAENNWETCIRHTQFLKPFGSTILSTLVWELEMNIIWEEYVIWVTEWGSKTRTGANESGPDRFPQRCMQQVVLVVQWPISRTSWHDVRLKCKCHNLHYTYAAIKDPKSDDRLVIQTATIGHIKQADWSCSYISGQSKAFKFL